MKPNIHSQCTAFVQQRIDELMRELNSLQDSKKADTKSSAGDKFETSTEMLRQEEEKINRMLMQAHKMKQDLAQINPDRSHDQIQLGSLVKTNKGVYYMSIPLGRIPVGENVVFCITMGSPIGQLLKGKEEGDEVTFNGNVFQILEVY
ncbi:MAG: hypothetical protein AAF193_11280 [Bacteroidota bacterium]